MPHKPFKPIYYLRLCRDGRYFFLWRMVYNKRLQQMEPHWWPEDQIGDSRPYLYKTLTYARNAIDRLELSSQECTILKWDERNGQTQDTSH